MLQRFNYRMRRYRFRNILQYSLSHTHTEFVPMTCNYSATFKIWCSNWQYRETASSCSIPFAYHKTNGNTGWVSKKVVFVNLQNRCCEDHGAPQFHKPSFTPASETSINSQILILNSFWVEQNCSCILQTLFIYLTLKVFILDHFEHVCNRSFVHSLPIRKQSRVQI